jgi:hypothetical protein
MFPESRKFNLNCDSQFKNDGTNFQCLKVER